MSTEEIKKQVIEVLAELFAEEGFDTDMLEYADLVDDLGMDSITFISIVVEIEDKFGIEVPDELLLMENFKNVDEIVRIVEKELERTTTDR